MELAFDASVIPQTVHQSVPDDLVLRPLASTDYSRGHLDVLAVLTTTPDVGEDAWRAQFQAMLSLKDTYYPIVLVSKQTDKVVATGTLLVERKFIRSCASVGHIEDISVDRAAQGKGLGKVIIKALTEISEALGCYKVRTCNECCTATGVWSGQKNIVADTRRKQTILDCDPKNEGARLSGSRYRARVAKHRPCRFLRQVRVRTLLSLPESIREANVWLDSYENKGCEMAKYK